MKKIGGELLFCMVIFSNFASSNKLQKICHLTPPNWPSGTLRYMI